MNKLELNRNNLVFLDGLRGLAALYVVICHARWILWEGYSSGYLAHSSEYGIIDTALVYFLIAFKYGHFAVLFFFVLSGFVIHLRYSLEIKEKKENVFQFKNYLWRRAKRIYPPLVFSLALTFILDYIGHSLGYTIYFKNTPNEILNAAIHYNIGWETLIGNLVFLQDAYVLAYGSNGPLWSLKYEWWFYMGYPLLLLINKKNIPLSCLTVVLLAIAGIALDYPPLILLKQISSYFIAWYLGCLLADMATQRIRINKLALSPLIVFIPLNILLESKIHALVLRDISVALGFMGFISVCFYLLENAKAKPFFEVLNKLKFLGDFSYSLYITHFPILIFMGGYFLNKNNNHFPRSFIPLFLVTIISLLFAYFAHLLVERPFTKNPKTSQPM